MIHYSPSQPHCGHLSVTITMILLPQMELNSEAIEKQLSCQQIGVPSWGYLHGLSCCDLSSNFKWSHLNALTRTENGKQEKKR